MLKMPRLGDTVDEVYVVEWQKATGEHVNVGDSLLLVETDKASVEVPSVVAGTLIEQKFKIDEPIKTGEVFAIIEV
jgi:pyruvate/2-oxoglutarate dehydrogenase complex dihydrolipoamide acyltransferase (E2) component